MHDEPIDPFAGDPADPSNELADLDEAESEAGGDPLTPAEREDVLEDLADLEIYQALLTPVGVRGLVIECEDCHEPHYFDWDLLRGNLRHLLDSGRPRVHEPAYDPDPDHYVTWEYAHEEIPLEAPLGAPVMDRMARALLAEDPGSVVVPYCMSGGTDAKQFSRLGMTCYGFTPLVLPEGYDYYAMFHGTDERIPLSALEASVRIMDRFLAATDE